VRGAYTSLGYANPLSLKKITQTEKLFKMIAIQLKKILAMPLPLHKTFNAAVYYFLNEKSLQG